MILFKVLMPDGRPANSDARATGYVYTLPTDSQPTDWTDPVADPVACERGYHLTTRPSRYWVAGASLFTGEGRGQMEEVTPEWHWLPLYPEARALLLPDGWELDEYGRAQRKAATPGAATRS